MFKMKYMGGDAVFYYGGKLWGRVKKRIQRAIWSHAWFMVTKAEADDQGKTKDFPPTLLPTKKN